MRDFNKLTIKSVCKYYGVKEALNDFTLEINKGEFITFLGPSGCGKSTALNCIAGLISLTSGSIFIDNECIDDSVKKIPTEKREFGMVFQNYALFPHLNVYDNIAFGLQIKKVPRNQIKEKIKIVLKLVHLEGYEEKYQSQMSGGEQQRVAVARSIVLEPRLLMYDEPLSNLDAKLRVAMRAELAMLHQKLQDTVIFVTHDQVEAMTLGDRIVVMKDSYIQQIASPIHLYNKPINKFVAGFIGSPPMNFLSSYVRKFGDQKIYIEHGKEILTPTEAQQNELKDYVDNKIDFGVRPEDITVNPTTKNKLNFRINVVEPLGAETYLNVSTAEGGSLMARVAPDFAHKVGSIIELGINMEKCHFFETSGSIKKDAASGIVDRCII